MNFLTRATLASFFLLALCLAIATQAPQPTPSATPENDFYSLRPQAEQEVGYFYQCGFVGPRDYAQAISWYRRAAAHGNSNAENQLGYMAGEGWGQPQDYVEALSWYYKAADHGNADAQENIGYLF